MKITTIQLEHNDSDTKEDRINSVCGLIERNAESDLILLPEMWNTGFFSYDKYFENAEYVTGDTITALRDKAVSTHTNIFTGSFVEKRDNKLYNTALMLNRLGEIIGRYSKIHLFGDERQYISRGEDICVCNTDIGLVGMSICYDLRFPELYRELTKQGAEILLSCYALPSLRTKHWQILTPARALENQALFVSCGCAGLNEGTEYAGHSMAVSPYGDILSEAGKDGAVISTSADVDEVREYRAGFSALRDRIF